MKKKIARSSQRVVMAVIILLFSNFLCAAGEDTPLSILKEVPSAYSKVSYEGVRISINWLDPKTPVVISRITHQQVWERIVIIAPPSQSGIIVIRQGNAISYENLPGSPIKLVPGEIMDLDLLFKNYEVNLIGKEKVAGRSAYIMEIRPRFPGRPYKDIWVDQQNFIILKNQDYSAEGKKAQLSFFVEINFKSPVGKEEFDYNLPKEEVPPAEVPLEEIQKYLPFAILIPSYLPSGFIFQQAILIPRNQQPVLHLIYGDGLCAISLFEESAGRGFFIFRPSQEAIRQEEGESKIVRWRQGRSIITVVSELSWEEIEKITKSIAEGQK